MTESRHLRTSLTNQPITYAIFWWAKANTIWIYR